MSDTDDSGERPEPANLRFLRILVTVLTAVMIAGVLAIVALLVTRLPGGGVVVPDDLALPAGTRAHAVTRAPDMWLVTTDDRRLLLFSSDGQLLREIPLD